MTSESKLNQIELYRQFILFPYLIFNNFSRYFRVHYPQTTTDISPGEHLLKKFWMHLEAHYFKKLDKDQLDRFQYIKQIFHENLQNGKHIFQDRQFQEHLKQIYTEDFLQTLLDSEKIQLDKQNLLNRLYITWKKSLINFSAKQSKTLQKKLKQSLDIVDKCKSKKTLQIHLTSEQFILKSVLDSDMMKKSHQNSTSNQLQNQISLLYSEILSLSNKSIDLLNTIQTKIFNDSNIQSNNAFSGPISNPSHSKPRKPKSRSMQIQTSFQQPYCNLSLEQILFIIKNLEQRQLAESMSKILECRKMNNQYYYLVEFEKAMYVEPQLLSENQIIRLNKMRETSLFQFYRTSAKSLYSYTCQNYIGFNELMNNRMDLGKYKPKDIFDLMKKQSNISQQVLNSFEKFSTCHHCKFLYPDYLLKSCKFQSDRQALPKKNYQATLDPDFSQILHTPMDKGRVFQRLTSRKKNCLTSYAKINEQFVCGRKYCVSCMKDCYPNDTINESNFCPFCRGNCNCSRCIRNEKIVKLRSAYTILGGDFLILNEQSCIQKLQNRQDNLIVKRRGRPKKLIKRIEHIAVKKVQKKFRLIDQNLKLSSKCLDHGITLPRNEQRCMSLIKQDQPIDVITNQEGEDPKGYYHSKKNTKDFGKINKKKLKKTFSDMKKQCF